jgi:hypothetical protein
MEVGRLEAVSEGVIGLIRLWKGVEKSKGQSQNPVSGDATNQDLETVAPFVDNWKLRGQKSDTQVEKRYLGHTRFYAGGLRRNSR